MNAIGYCRVSSQEQIEGTSLQSQETQIRAYAAMRGLNLVDVLSDAGVSGGKPLATRPEGAKLVEMLATKQVQTVIIVKLDRGFRSASDCLNTVEDWDRRGIALHIIDLGGTSIDTTTPTGKFMLTILAAAAEMERGMIRDRCNSGRAARRAEGKRVGEIPFGYFLGEDGKTLVKNEQEQETINLTVDLHSKGLNASGIANELNHRGVQTKKGAQWTHKQVCRILRKAA